MVVMAPKYLLVLPDADAVPRGQVMEVGGQNFQHVLSLFDPRTVRCCVYCFGGGSSELLVHSGHLGKVAAVVVIAGVLERLVNSDL